MGRKLSIAIDGVPEDVVSVIEARLAGQVEVVRNPRLGLGYDIGLTGGAVRSLRFGPFKRHLVWLPAGAGLLGQIGPIEPCADVEMLLRLIESCTPTAKEPDIPWTLALMDNPEADTRSLRLDLWQGDKRSWSLDILVPISKLREFSQDLSRRELAYGRAKPEKWLDHARDFGKRLTKLLFRDLDNRQLHDLRQATRLYVVVKRLNPDNRTEPLDAFEWFSLPFEWLVVLRDDPDQVSYRDLLAFHVPLVRYLGKDPSPSSQEFELRASTMRAGVLNGHGKGEFVCQRVEQPPAKACTRCGIREAQKFPQLDCVKDDIRAVEDYVDSEVLSIGASDVTQLRDVGLAVISAHGYPCALSTDFGVLYLGGSSRSGYLYFSGLAQVLEGADELKCLILNICLGAYEAGARSSGDNGWIGPAEGGDDPCPNNGDKRPGSALSYFAQQLPQGPMWLLAHRSYLSDSRASSFLSAFFTELKRHQRPPSALIAARKRHLERENFDPAVDRLYLGAMLVLAGT